MHGRGSRRWSAWAHEAAAALGASRAAAAAGGASAACPCLGCGCVVPRRDLPAHLATFAVEHARAVASELGELKATNQEQRALLERLTRTVQEQHATIEGAPPPQHCPHEPKPTLPAR